MEKDDKHMATPGAVEKPNRVWIEIEKPENDKQGQRRAIALGKVLNLLGIPYAQPVFWFPDKGRYCFQIDSGGSFVEAIDNGHWFNLDYLAKKEGK